MLARTLLLTSLIAFQSPVATSSNFENSEVLKAAATQSAPSRSNAFLPDQALYFTTVNVDALMRAAVIDRQGTVVGSVAELMVGATGRITDAVVRLTGGSLGVSGEMVVLSFDALDVEDTGQAQFESYLVHAAFSRDEIADLPRFEG